MCKRRNCLNIAIIIHNIIIANFKWCKNGWKIVLIQIDRSFDLIVYIWFLCDVIKEETSLGLVRLMFDLIWSFNLCWRLTRVNKFYYCSVFKFDVNNFICNNILIKKAIQSIYCLCALCPVWWPKLVYKSSTNLWNLISVIGLYIKAIAL